MVSMSYPDFPGSYRGIFIQKLCRELTRQGHRVIVVTPRIYSRSPLYENDEGIEIHRFRFPSGDKPLGQSSGLPILPMIWFMISGLWQTLSLSLRERPDIIHGNWIVPTGLIAALAGFILRIPVVNTARGMDIRISDSGPIRLLFNLAIRLSQRLVLVSPAMRSRPGLEQAEVIPSGVDDIFFSLTRDHDSPTIISTRSLEPIYDLETLLKSLPEVRAKFPEARCILAGTGSQAAYLKDLARQLGIEQSVDFVGSVPQQEIIRLLQISRIFVSSCIDDGTSVALLEAMAAGLIPVVTDIEANRPWVKNGEDGFLFPCGDSHFLAEHILQAISGHIAFTALEDKRALLKRDMAWSQIAAQYVKVYEFIRSQKIKVP